MSSFLSGFIGILAAFVLVILINLFLIKFGWSLFMVPVFNMAELSWMQALGFALLAGSLRPSSVSSKKE